ncbi:MAG: hypothetical protein KBD78_14705 [Oligoflexales bacterium]|nr:hypothetical protein [Oligoflexales bacterium]
MIKEKLKNISCIRSITAIVLILTLETSCSSENQVAEKNSKLKWGLLDERAYPGSLLDKKSGDLISICVPKPDINPNPMYTPIYNNTDYYYENYRKAILKWGAAINRNYRFEKRVYNNSQDAERLCGDADLRVVLGILSGTSDEVNRRCAPYGYPQAFVDLSSKNMLAIHCTNSSAPFVMLHETGHLFGLCDMVNGRATANCAHGTGVSDNGIMDKDITDPSFDTSIEQLNLSSDDIVGIKQSVALRKSTVALPAASCNPPSFGYPAWGYKLGDSSVQCNLETYPGQCLNGNILGGEFSGKFLACHYHNGQIVWSCHTSNPGLVCK